MFKCGKNVPTEYYIKACEVMEQYNNGEIRPRKLNNGKWIVLEVGNGKGQNSWRLICSTKGSKWKLISHQEYNKLIDR